MAIPQQLARELSDPAIAIQEFCNMAPGIPWSNQILDDMLETLESEGACTRITTPGKGLTAINGYLCWAKARKKKTIVARVTFDWHICQVHQSGQLQQKEFDFDRKGLKEAICFLQQKVQNIKRRGLCEPCNTGEHPKKRLRVGDTGLCASCLLQKSVL